MLKSPASVARIGAYAIPAIVLTSVSTADSTSSALRVHEGPQFDMFGICVSRAGDVNADEVGDYLVGAPGLGVGVVHVYSGATGSLLRSIWGPSGIDFFGYALAPLGDVDIDGHDDFIVGAPLRSFEGQVSVHSGRTGAPLWTRLADQEVEVLGWSVASVEDIDGDGHRDVIAGAPFYDSGFPVPSYHGRNRGRILVLSGATGAQLLEIIGENPEDVLGISVAGLGDMNGDGVPDVAAGARGRSEVRFFSGATGALIDRTVGSAGSDFGWALATIDDVTGDGASDLIVGARHAGQVSLVNGRTGRFAFTVDRQGDLGFSVANAGDVNGDGYSDIGAGAKHWPSGSGQSGGRVEVYSGLDGSPLKAFSCDQVNFGSSVAGIGDMNGDAVPDLLVGLERYGGVNSTLRGLAFVFSGEPAQPGDMSIAALSGPPSVPGEIVAADFNRDGAAEIITFNATSDELTSRENDGDGSLYPPARLAVGRAPASAIASDIDRDGDLDLVVALKGEGRLAIYTNTLGILIPSGTLRVARQPCAVVAADFNGDRRTDLAVAGQRDRVVQVFIQNPAMAHRAMHERFAPARTTQVPVTPSGLFAADFGGNNRLDILVASAANQSVATLINRGKGHFQPPRVTQMAGLADIVIGDFDGDQWTDIAWLNAAAQNITALRALGNGRFDGEVFRLPVSDGAIGMTTVALDHDAIDDLAWASGADQFVHCAIMRPGQPPLLVNHPVDVSPRWLAASDCDGDDDHDIIVIDPSGETLLLRNALFE